MPGKSPRELRAENERLSAENQELQQRADEAEQALEAIRTGQAESLIVEGPTGPRIFSLEGADHAYRVLVEAMNEGAATVGDDGTILYCNARFAGMLGAPIERVMGSTILRFLPDRSRAIFEALEREANGDESRGELELLGQGGQAVPAYVSVSLIHDDSRRRFCLVATDLRAQKRNEEIVVAERLARSVLEQAAEAIVVCDENGRIIRASGSASELCVGNPLLLEPFDDALPLVLAPSADEQGAPASLLAKAMRGEVLRAVPASLARLDGSKADLLVSAKGLHGSNCRIIGCVVTIVDVTEHNRAEAALRASEERFRLFLEELRGYAIFTLASDGTVASWNLGAERLKGYRAEEILGQHVSRFYPAGDIEAGKPQRALQVAAKEGRYEEEGWRVRKDGSLFWASVVLTALHDSAGRLRGFGKVVRDFTDRKRAEEALRTSEAKFRFLFENMVDGLAYCKVVFDDHHRPVDYVYLDVNDAFVKVTGLRDVVGKRVTEVLPGIRESSPESFEVYGRVASTGKPEKFEIYVASLEMWLAVTVTSPKIDHFVAMIDNVTDRKRVEEALREANLRLAETDARKNDFMAVLSHELRNPLAPIRNSLYILDRAQPGGDQAKRAQAVIDRQVGQLARLVDDLLDATRISRNKVQLKYERLDLNEVVRRTVEDHRSLFEKSGVRLDATFAADPVIVSADWARIAQVVGNLLNNAAKFTGQGGTTKVEVARDGAKRQAIVRIADTGAGISPEILVRLFQPFTQADRTLDRSKGGLGLGLALVKGLVEMHCGEVRAHSDGPGQGAEFVVRLPLDTGAALAASEPSAAARRARRILVIEDNVDAADSLREALELDGHGVEVAYSGSEGLERVRQNKPDLVLCDIGLPGIDGYEVARAVRADEALAGVHLVALSGYAMPEDLERAATAGFERHLAKPPSLEKIEEALGELSQAPE